MISMTHSQFLNVDLRLWLLKNYRLVSMIKFRLRVVQLPSDRLLTAACEELLSRGKKGSWSFKIRQILDNKIFSSAWNEGGGQNEMHVSLENRIKID